jgi:hypothetical protein
MDMTTLATALETHEQTDRLIDVAQSIGISIGAIGIIVSCIVLIYQALLLRAAAKTLTKDMRTIMGAIAVNTARLDTIELTLGIDRQNEDSPDAKPAKGS